MVVSEAWKDPTIIMLTHQRVADMTFLLTRNNVRMWIFHPYKQKQEKKFVLKTSTFFSFILKNMKKAV